MRKVPPSYEGLHLAWTLVHAVAEHHERAALEQDIHSAALAQDCMKVFDVAVRVADEHCRLRAKLDECTGSALPEFGLSRLEHLCMLVAHGVSALQGAKRYGAH